MPSDKISKKGVGGDRHRLVFICGMGNQFASIMINGLSAICATSMERFTMFEVTFPWMIFRDSTEEKKEVSHLQISHLLSITIDSSCRR